MTRAPSASSGRRSAALALALTFVALQGAAPDAARHERTLEALRTLTLSDAALQRDVLRARAGLLRSYDPIVALGRRSRRRRRSRCAGAASDATGATRAEIDRRVAEWWRRSTRQESARRGVQVAERGAAELARLLQPPQRPTAGAAGGASSRMPCSASPAGQRPEAAAEVSAALDRLAGSDRRRRGSARRARTPDRRHAAGGGRPRRGHPRGADRRSGRRRCRRPTSISTAGRRPAPTASACCSTPPPWRSSVYLGHLFLRLRANARSLRSRVAFESLIAAISTAFIDLPRERIGAGIDAGLARLGSTDRRRSRSVRHRRRRAVERAHAWHRAESGAARALSPRPCSPSPGMGLPGYESQGWIHVHRVAALPEGPEKIAAAAERHRAPGSASRCGATGDRARLSRLRLVPAQQAVAATTTSRCCAPPRRSSPTPSRASGARPSARRCRSGSPRRSGWRRWARSPAASRTSSTTSSA